MPNLPFFYTGDYDLSDNKIVLHDDTSRHILTVLRMKAGDHINLTDGKGNWLTAEIMQANKKQCIAEVVQLRQISPLLPKITIGISLIKNASRFEWFLEKAAEVGVNEIIPLICERTERQHFRHDRMKNVLISAMLQSQQCWLPILHEPLKFENCEWNEFNYEQKLIAHCEEGEKKTLPDFQIDKSSNRLILIGPEGDFTKKEIDLALNNQFTPVSLGSTRLRTETAGIVALVLLRHS